MANYWYRAEAIRGGTTLNFEGSLGYCVGKWAAVPKLRHELLEHHGAAIINGFIYEMTSDHQFDPKPRVRVTALTSYDEQGNESTFPRSNVIPIYNAKRERRQKKAARKIAKAAARARAAELATPIPTPSDYGSEVEFDVVFSTVNFNKETPA